MSKQPGAFFNLSPAEDAVMGGVCYADCFDFPPRLDELPAYIPFEPMSPGELETTVLGLVRQGRLHQAGDYYCLPGRESLAAPRPEKEAIVREKWSLLKRYLPTMLGFSWVRSALLTGSLAAGNPTPRADADLLLILDHRRMWLGYLLLRLWTRWMKKYIDFCPNYAISDRSLSLLYPNLFTAIELSLAIPLKSGPTLRDFGQKNLWSRSLIPNASPLEEKMVDIAPANTLTCKLLNLLVNSPLGWILDKLEYYRLRWRTRGLYLPRKTVYKPHPPTRQYLIFQALVERLNRHGIAARKLREHLEEQSVCLRTAARDWGIEVESLVPSNQGPAQRPHRPLDPVGAEKAN